MKIIFWPSLTLVILLLFLAAPQAQASLIEVNGRFSFYNPPEAGASTVFMYGLGLNFNFLPSLTLATAVEYTSYSAGGHNYSLMPVTADLIYHVLPISPVDPYLGAGLGYYQKTTDGAAKSSVGGQLRAGVDFNLLVADARLEARYMIPDFGDTSKSSFSWGGGIGGSFIFPF